MSYVDTNGLPLGRSLPLGCSARGCVSLVPNVEPAICDGIAKPLDLHSIHPTAIYSFSSPNPQIISVIA